VSVSVVHSRDDDGGQYQQEQIHNYQVAGKLAVLVKANSGELAVNWLSVRQLTQYGRTEELRGWMKDWF
jgi:hypothetical protein